MIRIVGADTCNCPQSEDEVETVHAGHIVVDDEAMKAGKVLRP